MLRVDLANCWDDAVVEGEETSPLRVGRLVHRVVSRYPRVPAVSLSNVLPQVDSTVLEVNVVPEGGVAGRVVGVPILVLAAGQCVDVEDSVDLVLGTLQHCQIRNQSKPKTESHTISTTRSTCLNPSSLISNGFMSSSKWW